VLIFVKFIISICLFFCAAFSSQAAISVIYYEIGNDLVVDMSGSVDTANLYYQSSTSYDFVAAAYKPFDYEGQDYLELFTKSDTFKMSKAYYFTSADRAISLEVYGAGRVTATYGTGNFIGLSPTCIFLEEGYISGSYLEGRTVFANASLSDLNLSVGDVYTYNWGTGGHADSATLTVVPEPSNWAHFVLLGALGIACFRRKRC